MTTKYINVVCLVNVNGKSVFFSIYPYMHEKHVWIIVIQISEVQIFFILTCLVITTVSRPTMPELISMKKRDGARGKLKIIGWITVHELTQCVDFAHKLLVDPLAVKRLHTNHK